MDGFQALLNAHTQTHHDLVDMLVFRELHTLRAEVCAKYPFLAQVALAILAERRGGEIALLATFQTEDDETLRPSETQRGVVRLRAFSEAPSLDIPWGTLPIIPVLRTDKEAWSAMTQANEASVDSQPWSWRVHDHLQHPGAHVPYNTHHGFCEHDYTFQRAYLLKGLP